MKPPPPKNFAPAATSKIHMETPAPVGYNDPMKCLVMACLLIATLAGFFYPAMAGESVNYLGTLKELEIQPALEKVKFTSCPDFLDHISKIAPDNPDIFLAGMAYDIALCVPQNLKTARDLYESALKAARGFPIIPVRLALIYAYGPEELRNPARSEFLIKQSAISLATTPDANIRIKIISTLMSAEPIPESFKKQLQWLNEVLKKNPAERKSLATKLAEQGFHDTELIWNPIEDYFPKQLKK